MDELLALPPMTITLAAGPEGPGSLDDFERFYAQRALARYRDRLGRDGLLALLGDDIEEGNAYLRQAARASDGRFHAGTTVLEVDGLTAGEFMSWMSTAFDDERALLAAHPEHYVMADQPDGTVLVVENIGPHVCSFFMGGWGSSALGWASEAAELQNESEFPHRMASNLFLEDGTVVGRVLTQFGDTAQGFSARLTVYLPTECSADVLEHHLRHFGVEFRNWIVAADAERR
jgi:hypothetical protein